MKPINEMSLAECLEYLRKLTMTGANTGLKHELADRIHELTRWIPVRIDPTSNHGWSFDYYAIQHICEEAREHDNTVSQENVDAILQVIWRRIDKP